MKRGISFMVRYDTHILIKVLNRINVTNYLWINDLNQNEIWSSISGGIALAKDLYKGSDFVEEIHHEHYILFMKLQAYFESFDSININTYDDFCKSECQMLILFADNKYVNIYAKDPGMIDILYDNALKNEFTNIHYIDEYNDRRKTMNIM